MDKPERAGDRLADALTYHTDFIADAQYLWCYEFEIEVLVENGRAYYAYPPLRAMLEALGEIQSRRDRRIRDRAFTVWAGDYGPYFCIAVPEKLPSTLIELIRRYLETVPGYRWEEGGYGLPFIPVFRYEYGDVIVYDDEGSAGDEVVDAGEEGPYGTGLVLHYRLAVPAGRRGERYQRGTTNSGPGWKPKP